MTPTVTEDDSISYKSEQLYDLQEEVKPQQKKPLKLAKKPSTATSSDFSARQANHLVERICQTNGIEAPSYTFARCLSTNPHRALHWSTQKHECLVKLAEYLSKRAAVEQEYAQSLKKLNRQWMQYAEEDERFSQLLVMGEKTATGHADFARKILGERVPEELKALCHEHEGHRRTLQGALKTQQELWKRAVGTFERVRKNKDRAQAAADASQLAYQRAAPAATLGQKRRLEADVEEKNRKALLAREDYNQAARVLLGKKGEIYGDHVPRLLESLERMERARIVGVRSVLVSLAQGQLAFAEVEVEGGERWLRSLVSQGVDDEIEEFIKSGPHGDQLLIDGMENDGKQSDRTNTSATLDSSFTNSTNNTASTNTTPLLSSFMSQSQRDLSSLLNDNWHGLIQQRDQLQATLQKLQIQLAGLQKMHESFAGQPESQEAVLQGLQLVEKEIEGSEELLGAVEQKLMKMPKELDLPLTNGPNPLSPIRSALQRLEEFDAASKQKKQQQLKQFQVPIVPKQRKKALSKSFEDVLADMSLTSGFESFDEASQFEQMKPVESFPKLPGMQWTRSRSNSVSVKEEIIQNRSNFRCELDEVEFESRRASLKREAEGEISKHLSELMNLKQTAIAPEPELEYVERFAPKPSQTYSIEDEKEPIEPAVQKWNTHDLVDLRPKWEELQKLRQPEFNKTEKAISSSSNFVNATATATTTTSNYLFKVQALYPFKGETENDELDLETGEILSVLDSEGEWWMAENEVGAKGYIPFNYVIKLK